LPPPVLVGQVVTVRSADRECCEVGKEWRGKPSALLVNDL